MTTSLKTQTFAAMAAFSAVTALAQPTAPWRSYPFSVKVSGAETETRVFQMRDQGAAHEFALGHKLPLGSHIDRRRDIIRYADLKKFFGGLTPPAAGPSAVAGAGA